MEKGEGGNEANAYHLYCASCSGENEKYYPILLLVPQRCTCITWIVFSMCVYIIDGLTM